ncbi:tetratricopeptide repeat protein [Photobacterium sp. ZSDE20]|uniref:Tetratricopeptide repeat protein n=1 Tax=Photobacterium pectinilyticum TaxID=2906793 RepID=A0ABT1N3H9_9GAMM|nr:tetratricopeptide repeat protein [Photobacterium sp. ZSDE20]MCQ1059287.1 tetratricopeptide repeat protein [Photobacterium sp. ZSDE20]MDD1824752.1 tetratricopeptide repeat protein [Photobacterium sp. ZSDE20]
MKALPLALLVVAPAMASEQTYIKLLESDVSVEVNPQQQYKHFDESPIWDTLNKEGWQAAKQAAGNQPISESLSEEIHYRSSLAQLETAIANKQITQSNQLLRENPQWVTCSRIQWAWLDLQQETQSGYGPNSKQKLSNLLSGCPKHGLSTTQKALGWTNAYASSDILTRYKNSSSYNAVDYEKLAYQANLARLSQQRLNANQTHSASQLISQKKDATGAELLGWQHLKNKQYSTALAWFDKSIGWTETPSRKQIEGKILSLQQLGKIDEAKRYQQLWSSRYPSLKTLDANSQSPKLAKACQSDPQQCLELLYKNKSLSAEQHALAGWQWYEMDRPLTAKRSFEKALEKMDSGNKQYETTQYGYTLALNKAGFEQHAEFLANNLADPSQKILYAKQRETKAILNAYEKQDYQYVIDHSENFEQAYGKEVGLAEIKGWAYYNQKQNNKAVETFRELVDAYPHDENLQDALKTAECAQKKSYKRCY